MIKSIKTTAVRTRRKFDQTFKREAVQNWLNSGKSAETVGEELGINANLLYAWRKLVPTGAVGRSPAAKPGQVDRGVFQRGFAVQQVAPGFDRGLGLLDVFEKFEFGVIAAPAPALEQFGEVFQPLLGKVAPARNDVAAARHVCRKCHKLARKRETDADAT